MKAPRVSTYRGMIFARFAETGESLEEHFGPLKKYRAMERSRVELGLPVLEVLTRIPYGLFGM